MERRCVNCIHHDVCEVYDIVHDPAEASGCRNFLAKSEIAREVISKFRALVTSRMLKMGIFPVALHRTLEYVEKELTEKYTEEKR